MKASNESIFFASPAIVSFFTFVPYVLLGNTLAPQSVFLTIAFQCCSTLEKIFALS